jgi:hypothetical protein
MSGPARVSLRAVSRGLARVALSDSARNRGGLSLCGCARVVPRSTLLNL